MISFVEIRPFAVEKSRKESVGGASQNVPTAVGVHNAFFVPIKIVSILIGEKTLGELLEQPQRLLVGAIAKDLCGLSEVKLSAAGNAVLCSAAQLPCHDDGGHVIRTEMGGAFVGVITNQGNICYLKGRTHFIYAGVVELAEGLT